MQSPDEGGWGHYHSPNTRLLTERLSDYHEVEFADLCCSGTFAIELALRALQNGPGDEGILAGYDSIGNFNAFHFCRSSRRFRETRELAITTFADANMLVLHHPALLECDETIDQITRGIHRIRAWADPIKKACN